MSRRATADRGIALIVVMLAMTLLMGLGLALIMVTMTESAIAGSYADATQAFYAAEAAVEYTVQEVAARPDWEAVATGQIRSTFRDDAVLSVIAPDDTSRAWTLFAYGRLQDLLAPVPVRAPYVIAVWIAPEGTGGGALALLGHAYGANGSRRAIELIVARAQESDAGARPRVMAWREVR